MRGVIARVDQRGQRTPRHDPGNFATITDTVGRVTTLNYTSGHDLAVRRTYTKSVARIPTYPDSSSPPRLHEDAWENLTRTIDRNGNETIYEYDSHGNVLTKTDPPVPPDPVTVTHDQYDSKNNLTQITDARNFVTTNTYDAVTNVKLSTTQQTDTQVPPTNAITKWGYTDALNPGLPGVAPVPWTGERYVVIVVSSDLLVPPPLAVGGVLRDISGGFAVTHLRDARQASDARWDERYLREKLGTGRVLRARVADADARLPERAAEWKEVIS